MGKFKLSGMMENIHQKNIDRGYVKYLLKKHRIGFAEDEKIAEDLITLFVNAKLDKVSADNLMKNAKNTAILLTDGFVTTENLLDILTKTNINTIEAISKVYKEFMNVDEKATPIGKNAKGKTVYENTGFSNALKEILGKHLEQQDSEVIEIKDSTIEDMNTLAYIYNTLRDYLPSSEFNAETQVVSRPAETAIRTIASGRFLEHINKENIGTIKEVCEILTSTDCLGEDALSSKELESLVSRCTSILYTSSKAKVVALKDNINNYKDYLLEKLQSDKAYEELIKENITFKKTLSRSGVILATPPDTQVGTYHLLTGKNLGEALELSGSSVCADSSEELMEYKKMKVHMDPKDLYNFLTNSPSMILSAFTPSTLCSINKEFNVVLTKLFNDNEITNPNRLNHKQFPLENLVNGKNLLDLLELIPDKNRKDPDKEERINGYTKNILTLSKVMDGTQIFKVMQNNIKIIAHNPEKLAEDIDKIINENQGDLEKLAEEINKYVNQKMPCKNKRVKTKDENTTDNSDKKRRTRRSKVPANLIDTTDDFDITVDIFDPNKTTDDSLDVSATQNPTTLINNIEECLENINKDLHTIQTYVKENKENTLRIRGNSIVKNINLLKQLIYKLSEFNPNLATSYVYRLNNFKNDCNTLMQDLNNAKSTIASENPTYQRGREYHKNPDNNIKSVFNDIQTMKSHAKNLSSKELIAEFLNDSKKKEKAYKETIADEQKISNADRIILNQNFVDSLEGYSSYSVAVMQLNNIINALSAEIPLSNIQTLE